MLYFSDTVCVLTLSSSLPARDGALESSKGDANGPWRLSLLPASDSQLVRLEDIADCVRELGSDGMSWYGRGPRFLEGGSSISEDSAMPGEAYMAGEGRICPWLLCNRSLDCPGVPGSEDTELSDRMLSRISPPLPELTVMCGGLRPGPKFCAIFPYSKVAKYDVEGVTLIYDLDPAPLKRLAVGRVVVRVVRSRQIPRSTVCLGTPLGK